MKKCIIFGGSKIDDYSYISIIKGEDDLVICADYGYIHAQKLNLSIDFIIGDFDSATVPNFSNTIKLNCEKDETDMFMCIEKGVESGYTKFYIYGALGGRFDHSYANIQLLSYFVDKGIRIYLIDESNEMFMIKNELYEINGVSKKYFSVFSYTEFCDGLSIKGAKYPVDNYRLDNNYPLGVSNEILDSCAKVEVKSGKALIVFSSDKQ